MENVSIVKVKNTNTYPVKNVTLWTPLLLSNLCQGEVEKEATFSKGSVLWRTENGDGGGYGDLDNVSAFTDTHAS